MLSKAKLKLELESFPEFFTIDELVSRLIVLERRELENKFSKPSHPISVEELDKEVEKWLRM